MRSAVNASASQGVVVINLREGRSKTDTMTALQKQHGQDGSIPYSISTAFHSATVSGIGQMRVCSNSADGNESYLKQKSPKRPWCTSGIEVQQGDCEPRSNCALYSQEDVPGGCSSKIGVPRKRKLFSPEGEFGAPTGSRSRQFSIDEIFDGEGEFGAFTGGRSRQSSIDELFDGEGEFGAFTGGSSRQSSDDEPILRSSDPTGRVHWMDPISNFLTSHNV